METQSRNRAALVIVALAGMLASAALTAGQKSDVPVLAVDYSDLDLTTAKGVQALHRRLTTAVKRVCPRTDVVLNALDRVAARECQKQALDRAVNEIGNADLAALHAATTTRG